MKSLKKIAVFLALAFVIALITPDTGVGAATLKLNKKKVTMYAGKTVQLKLNGAAKSDVKWSTSDKKVATVSDTGKVKGKKKGTAIITATYKNASYTCKVKVKKPYLNIKNADMNPGESFNLVLTGTVAKKWTSSDSKVVKVSNGKVTAVSKGTATVTVTGKDKKKYKAVINVYDISGATAPKVKFIIATDANGKPSYNALNFNSTVYGWGPKDADFGRKIPDELRENLWRGDMTAMRYAGVTVAEGFEGLSAEPGYFWAKILFVHEMVDTQRDDAGKLYITAEDNAKTTFTDNMTIRYVDDIFRSPLDGVKADKDGFYTFSLNAGGKVYDNCKFKIELVKEERDWLITLWTMAYIKLPVEAKGQLAYFQADWADDVLKGNTGTDGTTSFWYDNPVICDFETLNIYSMKTASDPLIVGDSTDDGNEEQQKLLGLKSYSEMSEKERQEYGLY